MSKISSGEDDIFIATRQGMSIRFHESEVRAMGRSARGVKGITLAEGDYVVSLEVIRKGLPMTILTVSEKGFGKRSDVEEYRVQGRGGVGIITQGNIEKVGAVVGARVIRNEQEVILTTDSGQMIRIPGSSISVIGRNTQGVKFNYSTRG
jgi:DNA gyrase subunit A